MTEKPGRSQLASLTAACAVAGLLVMPLIGNPDPLHDHAWRLGTVWFAAVLWLTLAFQFGRNPKDPSKYILVLSLAAAWAAVAVAWRELFVTHLARPGAFFASLLVIGILFLSIRRPVSTEPTGTSSRGLRISWRSAAVVGWAVFCWAAVEVTEHIQLLRWLKTQPRIEIPGLPDHQSATNAVRIVVFSNFDCRLCKARHADYDEILNQLSSKEGSRIVVDRIQFPFDARCNSMLTGAESVSPAGCDAASLFHAAQESGMSREIADRFYSALDPLSIEFVESEAAKHGLSTSLWSRRAQRFADVVREVEIAKDVGLQFVPSYFVDGISTRGWSAADLRTVILARLGHWQVQFGGFS